MDQRTQFLIQVLEKIGGPLAAAAAATAPVEGDDKAGDAKRVAELLNRSVQLGLTMAETMNVRDESQADGVHLALTAFAGPLIAGQYLATGRVPGETEVRRLSGALQTVLTFADTFTPAADSTLRLENIEAGSSPADETLVHIQMLTAFGPVFQVVGDYAFGRQENKLIQEITGRLIDRAEDLRDHLFADDLPPKHRSQAELVLLRALAPLYSAAHVAETRRLLEMDDKDRSFGSGGISMDGVWASFDRQVEMLRVVAEQIASPKKAPPANEKAPAKDGKGKAVTGKGGDKAPAKGAIPGIPKGAIPGMVKPEVPKGAIPGMMPKGAKAAPADDFYDDDDSDDRDVAPAPRGGIPGMSAKKPASGGIPGMAAKSSGATGSGRTPAAPVGGRKFTPPPAPPKRTPPPAGDGNPMAFFAKKSDDDDEETGKTGRR